MEPTNSMEPTDSKKLTEPTKPAEPKKSNEPTKPIEPQEPAQTTEPTKPTEHLEPTESPDDGTADDLRLFRIWLRASRAIFGNVGRDIESHGLSPDNFMILELLYNKGPQPIQKISERMGIPSGSITYVIDKLEKKGYVERRQSQEDRRTSNAVLTAAGRALFDDIFPKHVAMISRNLSVASPEEKHTLAEVLKRIGLHAASLGEERDG
ncbi:MarR family transcriptional regulator [Cohnella sp. GCM10012308]|uniref:MarR family winged helix-turn-helix transcriptional regulator n=1 Tax=Cohnella sp. GCM10012308 TaxID=3317329 RepID=UPI00361D63D3